MKVQIILARTKEEARIVEHARVDLGERHKFETIQVPTSCLWLKRGSDADIEKARAFAAKEGYSVFTYPTSLRNSLEQAKLDLMAQ